MCMKNTSHLFHYYFFKNKNFLSIVILFPPFFSLCHCSISRTKNMYIHILYMYIIEFKNKGIEKHTFDVKKIFF